jgi:hypothetical protein
MREYKNDKEPPLFHVSLKEVIAGLTRERYAELELSNFLIAF